MEGVVGAVLSGRSLGRDGGFLGRLALDVLAGVDAAHASPPSDSEVLSLVVEELEVSQFVCDFAGFVFFFV